MIPTGIHLQGFGVLVRAITGSINTLENGQAIPLSQVRKSFQNYAKESFRTLGSQPSRGTTGRQGWAALSRRTRRMRLRRLGYYKRKSGSSPNVGVWTGDMFNSLVASGGKGAIRRGPARKSRYRWSMEYGSRLKKAYFFHRGTVKQPSRQVVPMIPSDADAAEVSQNSDAEAITLVIYDLWLRTSLPIIILCGIRGPLIRQGP